MYTGRNHAEATNVRVQSHVRLRIKTEKSMQTHINGTKTKTQYNSCMLWIQIQCFCSDLKLAE